MHGARIVAISHLRLECGADLCDFHPKVFRQLSRLYKPINWEIEAGGKIDSNRANGRKAVEYKYGCLMQFISGNYSISACTQEKQNYRPRILVPWLHLA